MPTPDLAAHSPPASEPAREALSRGYRIVYSRRLFRAHVSTVCEQVIGCHRTPLGHAEQVLASGRPPTPHRRVASEEGAPHWGAPSSCALQLVLVNGSGAHRGVDLRDVHMRAGCHRATRDGRSRSEQRRGQHRQRIGLSGGGQPEDRGGQPAGDYGSSLVEVPHGKSELLHFGMPLADGRAPPRLRRPRAGRGAGQGPRWSAAAARDDLDDPWGR